MFNIERKPRDSVAGRVLKKGFKYEPARKFNQKPRGRPLAGIEYMGPEGHNLIGKRFGRFVVVCYLGKKPNREVGRWDCRCDCGNYQICKTTSLKRTHDKHGKRLDRKCEPCNYVGYLKMISSRGCL